MIYISSKKVINLKWMFNKIFCKNEVNLNLFLKNFIKKPAFKIY